MYTKQNLEAIEKAISDMQAGRRVVGVSYGDTRVQYANLTLAELLNLRNRIKVGIENSEKFNKRQVIFQTSKGLI
ncbi:MAG: gpW family protein [Holosporaceae bacterium]|jgi:precorrin-3B methylase|nr:gpW family protein [Holosporaceae bacterium]